MSTRLIDALATTGALAAIFSDESIVRAMLDVEAELARAQARLQLIPAHAADAIAAEARAEHFDADAIAAAARSSGSVVIPLVKALTERVRTTSGAAAGFVHWGVTSQDIADTAFVRCLVRAHDVMAADHEALSAALERLSDEHAGTIMIGRTLLQPAPPVTFGLKAAAWRAACQRSWARVGAARAEAAVVQLGGASGTLAALGPHGLEISELVAAGLGLGAPDGPWHAYRDRLAGFVAALGIYTGTLGKIARDISLMMQAEVGEASEPGGGSSTMPQKRNPAQAATVLAAATRAPGMVAAFLSGMVQEHERSVGGWHAEWPTVATLVQVAGSALAALAQAVAALEVSPARMRENLDATGGAILAECVMMRLGAVIGRDAAHALVERASAESRRSGQPLMDVLAAMPEVTRHLSPAELTRVCAPEAYLGLADTLRLRLLGRAPKPAAPRD